VTLLDVIELTLIRWNVVIGANERAFTSPPNKSRTMAHCTKTIKLRIIVRLLKFSGLMDALSRESVNTNCLFTRYSSGTIPVRPAELQSSPLRSWSCNQRRATTTRKPRRRAGR
jgi:hypothetical protein